MSGISRPIDDAETLILEACRNKWEDMHNRWVKTIKDDILHFFYLVATLVDPRWKRFDWVPHNPVDGDQYPLPEAKWRRDAEKQALIAMEKYDKSMPVGQSPASDGVPASDVEPLQKESKICSFFAPTAPKQSGATAQPTLRAKCKQELE